VDEGSCIDDAIDAADNNRQSFHTICILVAGCSINLPPQRLLRRFENTEARVRRTYWLMRRISIVLRSNMSRYGIAAWPSRPVCMPTSSYNFCQPPPVSECESTHHDRLALVLQDMARSTDFLTSTKTLEHELILRSHRVIVDIGRGSHVASLSLGSPGVQ
jgi:hypothetical protein